MRKVVVSILLFVAGCGGAEREAMRRDMEELRGQVAQLRRANDSLTVQVEDVQNRLFLMRDELDSQRMGLARSDVPPRLPVIRIGPDDADDGGGVALEAKARSSAPLTFQEIDEDGNIVGEKPLFREPAARAPGGEAFSSPPREPPQDEDPAAMRLYQSAYDALQAGRAEGAISQFEEFVRRFPRHSYADNALYWLGEAHYARNEFTQALDAFQSVIRDYPMGNKVPDAMLKMGLCYHNLRQYAQAKTVLGQVVEIYPGSPISRVASERLRQIP